MTAIFNKFPTRGLDQVHNPDQFSVMVPMSDVLFDGMRAWTHRFYPELTPDQIEDVGGASLANGTQYVHIDSIDEDSSRY